MAMLWLCYMRLWHGYVMVMLYEVMARLCYGYVMAVAPHLAYPGFRK